MIAHLTAFGRLNGQMEVPDNWDWKTDIHLPFDRSPLGVTGFDGAKLGKQDLGVSRAVFRYLGKCHTDGPIFHLIEVRP